MTTARTPNDAPAVSRRMSRQRVRDTDPEVRLRKALFERGRRFRVGYPVPGMPRCSIDVAFPKARVAVLVDGCFWHRCPLHATAPKTNALWWQRKLQDNVDRDRRVTAALTDAGWTTVRIWEHETVTTAVDRVETALALQNGPTTGRGR